MISSRATSPAWYVSNGRNVVGPVDTDLLLRGVAAGRVEETCFVWQPSWPRWRRVDTLREVRAARSTPTRDRFARPLRWHAELARGVTIARVTELLEGAADADEVILLALGAAVEQTGAAVGLGHRPIERLGRLQTRWAHGALVGEQLGAIVDAGDAAARSARLGVQSIPRPYGVRAGEAAARRLSPDGRLLRGVVLVPLYHRAAMLALLELGRFDHGFRSSDLARLRIVGGLVQAKLGRRGFGDQP